MNAADRQAFGRVEEAVRLSRYGGDCYAYCMVAAGHVDLVIETELKPYDVLPLVPIIVASWALGGLYLSLGPSVAAGLFGLSNHLIGGLVVTLLCGAGAVTALTLRSWPTSSVLGISAVSLSAGTAMTLAGVEVHAVWLAGIGTVVAGIGFGASALASFGTLARIASPGERSELFAFALVIAYVAFSHPAVVAGYAATSAGLHATTVVYSLGVITFGLIALAAQGIRTSRLAL